ncbi:MAG: MBL fold metallo-hydrolase [Planctomycetes bacterium]|nr:MBL fold metallo-hydrolase [Planctomycetota bacterium]
MPQRRSRPRLKLLFLGTGNAFNEDGRGSQCLWVEPRGRPPFLVDAGPTALAAMQRAGVDPGRLSAAFFTHLHGDHTAGWPFILLHAAFVALRSRPLRVYGPRGTRRRLERLATACYEDLLVGGKLPFPLEHAELPVARACGLRGPPGVRFDVVPVEHHPTSIGYRLRAGGVTVGVSGDTRWCPGLEELGAGCDLLVVECTDVRRPRYAHVSLEEVRAGLPRLGARRVALVHVSDDVARAFRRRPIPGVTVAEDGMILGL